MITRQEAYKLYKEFVNVFNERVNELRFICSKRELSFHKEFTMFGNNILEPMSLKYKEWENQVRMNDIVGVLGQLGHLVHELNK